MNPLDVYRQALEQMKEPHYQEAWKTFARGYNAHQRHQRYLKAGWDKPLTFEDEAFLKAIRVKADA